jgi:hypothetical protein
MGNGNGVGVSGNRLQHRGGVVGKGGGTWPGVTGTGGGSGGAGLAGFGGSGGNSARVGGQGNSTGAGSPGYEGSGGVPAGQGTAGAVAPASTGPATAQRPGGRQRQQRCTVSSSPQRTRAPQLESAHAQSASSRRYVRLTAMGRSGRCPCIRIVMARQFGPNAGLGRSQNDHAWNLNGLWAAAGVRLVMRL